MEQGTSWRLTARRLIVSPGIIVGSMTSRSRVPAPTQAGLSQKRPMRAFVPPST